MKPMIGIPCYQETLTQELRPRFTLYQPYVQALAAAGAAPVLIPLALDQEANQTLFARLDGILLAGGDDVNPARYGQVAHPKTEVPDDARDDLEICLAQWAVAERKPLMAVCRGIQLLNVAMGGTLFQDIQDLVPGALQHTYPYNSHELRGKPTQDISIEPGSRLARVLGTQASINSFHHQGLAEVPDGFQIVARTTDGVIEAIESSDDRLVFGVQWHPEDMYDTDEKMLNLFKMFVATIG
jgi:putative glutamine amidotransferase